MEFVSLNFGLEAVAGRSSRPGTPSLPGGRQAGLRLPDRTDFSILTGKRVLILADEDNIRISTLEHGLRLSFDLLLRKLSETARKVAPWAVITARAGDARRETYLLRRGWRVLTMPRETVATVNGLRTKANADMDLCFLAGQLVAKVCLDATLIASGDGDLCIAVGRGIRRIRPAQAIVTASVPGSTSHRIMAANNPLFDGNILLGRDMMRSAEPLSPAIPRSDRREDLSEVNGEHRARFSPVTDESRGHDRWSVGKH